MSTKKKIFIIACIAFVALLNIFVFYKVRIASDLAQDVELSVLMQADGNTPAQLYYASGGANLSDENSQTLEYNEIGTRQTLDYTLSLENDMVRLDLGNQEQTITIYDITAVTGAESVSVDLEALAADDSLWNDVGDIAVNEDGSITFAVTGEDPYVFISSYRVQIVAGMQDGARTKNLIYDIIICLIMDLVALYSLRHLNALIEAPLNIWRSRKLLMTLAKNDFKQKFAGSYLGVVWAFIQPIVTILVYWFVFQVGFKSSNVQDYPFVLYLVAGIVPWFFFSDALNGGTNSLFDYSYLVKKVVFNINILPVVKIVSAFFVHLFFIAFSVVILCGYGYFPTIYILQIIYYIFCNFVLLVGLSYLCSAIAVFFKDMIQFINVFVLSIGMWLTPIMWDAENMLPPLLYKIFKLNPMFYIVDGFRDAFLYHDWFWTDKISWTLYFWVFTFLVYGFGVMIFRRLKVHFADVL